jgi:hypothetical protein
VDLQAYYDSIAAAGGPILRPVEVYYEPEEAVDTQPKLQHCRAIVEDRTIFFSMTTAQFYGEGDQKVLICWEVGGEVFVGEMDLADVNGLDILSETHPKVIVDNRLEDDSCP